MDINIQNENSTKSEREYYIYHNPENQKEEIILYDPITQQYYNALTDDIYIDFKGLNNIGNNLEKITLTRYNDIIEKDIINSPFIFANELYVLSQEAEKKESLEYVEEQLQEALATTELLQLKEKVTDENIKQLQNDIINIKSSINSGVKESSVKKSDIEESNVKEIPKKGQKKCVEVKRIARKEGDYSFKHITEYIKTNFADFEDNNIQLSLVNISDDEINKISIDSAEITSIEDAIYNVLVNETIDKKDRLQFERFIKLHYFYRSYIDLYHDILKYGDIYCEYIYKQFLLSDFFEENSILTKQDIDADKDKFIKKIEMIKKTIKTSGNEINQNKCKLLLEELTDQFIEYLHTMGIKWIPKKKEEARVMSIDINNQCDIDTLIEVLKDDGVDSFYVESANSGIGKKLANITGKDSVTDRLDLTDIQIGSWNAGSGFSKGVLKYFIEQSGGGASKKRKREENNNEILKDTKRQKVTKKQLRIQNKEVELFNLFRIIISNNNKKLINKYQDKYITIDNGPDKLSVNAILKALGHPPIRSSAGTKEEKNIKKLQVKTDEGGNNVKITPYNAMLVSLKTWTDLVQIITLSKSKNIVEQNTSKNFKTAVIISDRLCETTARMYGLGHVLLNQSNVLTYYNYDINSRKLSKDEIMSKIEMFNTIKHNKNKIITYLDKWFDEKINFLVDVINNTTDSKLYFITLLLSKSYIKRKENYKQYLDIYENTIEITIDILKQVPYTIDKLLENITETSLLMGEFQELIELFSLSLKGLDNLKPRSSTLVNDFLDTYNSIKQLIVNTYIGKTESTTEYDIDKIINSYTSLCIAFKLVTINRDISLYKITFISLIESIISEDVIIKCSSNSNINKDLKELINEIKNIFVIGQLPLKLSNLITYLTSHFKESISINYLEQVYNVALAFNAGEEYITKHAIKLKHLIIFKDFINYCFDKVTNSMKIDSIIYESFTKCPTGIFHNNRNTRKNSKFSLTKKNTNNYISKSKGTQKKRRASNSESKGTQKRANRNKE